ncbi:TetR/AcrR family transcriptional regulator [Flavobacterium sp. FlaQc-52]|jgi:AcrR family transcriptional regulator|uniref:TetR/AcrR family transcriptional regulator n=1 Tax=Flavobacterium cupriresistens TaxID=2893885 RepID=A0ABU4RBC2_9FLAO|nr:MULTISPECIES: TetR/AcrR family transcriptional regulator [unclassified Flavobacterium]MDX6188934.1 TetR/AcrR family transcriptional regulator [Flavobacterium sp. Fl-318]UFH44285.1 TetR/AcrR family transcriptional regulator [Flavobacterium sp. F-323]
MNAIFSNIKIQVNEKLYVKDPETSDLGKKIVGNSILLIDQIGIEHFTFKKLGEQIGSNESSIYRYFENKHKLVVYLSSWYWGWMEYKLVFATNNITNPTERLHKAITIVTEKITNNPVTTHIDEAILNKIIISEFTKTIYTKEVDEDNKEGFFLVYKRVINRIISIVQEVNPNYPFAKSLVSSIVEGSLHQHFLNEHLKTITDCNEPVTVTSFYLDLVDRILSK